MEDKENEEEIWGWDITWDTPIYKKDVKEYFENGNH